jgi:amidase
MQGFAEYVDYDGLGLAELIRTGQVSVAEVLEAAIARIERLNPILNAVVTKVYDEARGEVPALDGAAPFAGVPFLLKDLGGAQAGVPLSAARASVPG